MIVIALATYQGERYLSEFLSSIQQQTESDWTLLVRDDGSTDQTRAILERFAHEDSRIVLCRDDQGNLGAAQNFSRLMQTAVKYDPAALFFADQDDVWLPQKLAVQSQQIRETETRLGCETPILVHSDAKVVDHQLTEVHPSFRQFSRLQKARRSPLKTLLAHNYVTGCTSAVNAALLRRCSPIPETAFMHDWWIALVAASVGQIVFDEKPTVLYRQHEQNVIGARRVSYFQIARDLLTGRRDWEQDRQLFQQTVAQAETLRDWLQVQPDAEESLALVEQYCDALTIPGSSWRRLWKLTRAGMPGLSPARRLLYCYRLLRTDLDRKPDTIPFPERHEKRHLSDEKQVA